MLRAVILLAGGVTQLEACFGGGGICCAPAPPPPVACCPAQGAPSYAKPAGGYAVVPPASGYAVGPQLSYPAPPPSPLYPSAPAPQLPSYSLPSYRPYAAAPQMGPLDNQFTPIGGGSLKLPPTGPAVGGSYAPSLGGGSSYLPAPQGGSYSPSRPAPSTFQEEPQSTTEISDTAIDDQVLAEATKNQGYQASRRRQL